MTAVDESWGERWRASWRSPRSLTALIPLAAAGREEVHARLESLAPSFARALAPVDDLHSFRLLAAPAAPGGKGIRILLNSVHDRPLAEHLSRLIAAAGDLLVAALAGAEFSGAPADLPALLVRCRVRENTFHLGAINKSVAEIRAEQRLREAVEAFADERIDRGDWSADTPAEGIRGEIREYVLAQPPGSGLPRGPASPLTFGARSLRFVDLLVTFAFPAIGVLSQYIAIAIRRISPPLMRSGAWLAYALWWVYGAVFTGAAFAGVRLLEKIEPDIVAPPPDPAKVERLENSEDRQPINEVTYWFPVRNTWIRRRLLGVILWGSERGCRHFWTDGELAGIDTIHYARILQVDGGTTMIFLSDYDGSLDRYLSDFTGVGSGAVIPISSSLAGCPKTRWLFQPADPGTFALRLRDLLRLHQLETPVWYSAYPDLSVRDIIANAAVRAGLFAGKMSETDAANWAARL